MAVLLERTAKDCAIVAWKDGTILVAQLAGKSSQMAISPYPWDEWLEVKVPESHGCTISRLACASNRPLVLVSGSYDGTVIAWEIRQEHYAVAGACPWAEWWDGNCYSLCDECCRLSGGNYRQSVDFSARVWKTFTGHTKPVTAVCCSADGGLIVSGAADSTVRVWSFATGQELYALKGCHDVTKCIAMSADGGLIAVGCGQEVQLWSSASGTGSSERPRTPTSPLGHSRQHKLARNSKLHQEEVRCIALSADGIYVASGSADMTVHVWNSTSGQTLHKLQYDGQANAVAMSAGGTFVMTAFASGYLCIWDRETGKQLATLECKDAPAVHLVASGDGSILGTISQGHVTRIWAWLAEPDPKALQRLTQLAAWEGRPKLLHSRINVFGAEGVGKTSLVKALAGQVKQKGNPNETSDIGIWYYEVEQTPGTRASTLTPISRDIAGYHLLAWRKAVENKSVDLRNEGRVISEVDVKALSKCSVSVDGRHSWSPLRLVRRFSNPSTPSEDAKDKPNHQNAQRRLSNPAVHPEAAKDTPQHHCDRRRLSSPSIDPENVKDKPIHQNVQRRVSTASGSPKNVREKPQHYSERRRVSQPNVEPENAKDKPHHHFKLLRALVDKGHGSPASPTAKEIVLTPKVKDCSFHIPELDDIIPCLYTAEVDDVVHEQLKHNKPLLQGRAVVYDFGYFPGHDALYPLFLTKGAFHLVVFNMQELQPGDDDGLRTIHSKTQKVAQWREQCIAQLKSWATLLGEFENHSTLLVGTHRDLVPRQEDHRAIHTLLYAHFQERFVLNFQEELCFFPVDSQASPEDHSFAYLRWRITWNEEKVPVKSLRFLTAIEHMQKPLVTLNETLIIGKEHTGMDPDEVKSTLRSLHRMGLLAWWPDINDGSHVVVDLPWLLAKVTPMLKEANTCAVPFKSLIDKMKGLSADQMAFFHALARRIATKSVISAS